MDPRSLTLAFNEQINNRDLDGLAQLMTDDHTFIGTADHAIRGKSDCLEVVRRLQERLRPARRRGRQGDRGRPLELFGSTAGRPRLV